jgi:hypothetical protein
MACSKIAFAMLILASVVACSANALAQADTPGQGRLAQASTPPAPPSAPSAPTPPSPPVATQPAAPATGAANPIGSVATLQGTASVTRNNAGSALTVRDAIYQGDDLQTGTDGTLGITFDDETTFTLKPNSRITVDDFVYREGGANNAAVFDIFRGTVAFVAAEVAKTGDMKIDTPTATMGIRGTTGLVEIPAGATAGTNGQVSIKLYADADGRVGRIEVFGRDGTQLGILSRGTTGFAIRPGAPGAAQRFTAVPLQISAQEAARDRSFVRQAFSAQLMGRQINIQRRNPNLRQPNLQRPNQLRPNQPRPNVPRHGLRTPPGAQPLPSPGSRPMLQQRPGTLPQAGRPGLPTLQRHPALPTPPGLPKAPGGQKKAPQKKKNQNP